MELLHKQNNVRNKNISQRCSKFCKIVEKNVCCKNTSYAYQGFIYLIKKT